MKSTSLAIPPMFTFFTFNSFTEMEFTYRKIHTEYTVQGLFVHSEKSVTITQSILGSFHHPQMIVYHPLPPVPCPEPPLVYFLSLDFPFLGFHVNGTIWYVIF